jgi:hypothetical protein
VGARLSVFAPPVALGQFPRRGESHGDVFYDVYVDFMTYLKILIRIFSFFCP